MCWVFLCDERERELGRRRASGSCPCCGGKVVAIDSEIKWMFCLLTICHNIKRKYSCTLCSKRLELCT
ncbi:hypothetical protein K2173_009516 [Erythroxylum novogranatense]|uniref:Uncharacterized protein n=1 Tax=Erythroxylum novogranatense TaxID=1862640 RepID=A0AAV8U4A4_9ROSI|nr:hypothetical protein K2173_009516 [Erythroxylum novogranatense]